MNEPKETAFQKRMREFHQVREQLAEARAAAKQERLAGERVEQGN